MNFVRLSATRRLCVLALICLSQHAALGQAASAKITNAAKAFLSSLDEKQRQSVLFAYDDEKQRVRWSNLPTTMVKRAGLAMKDLTPAQHAAAMALLSNAFSKRGFEKVMQIVDGDEVLKNSSNGPNVMFGKDLFYISLLGTPSETAPWMLQFGGHHLAINVTIAGERGILTPSLTGAQPALYTLNGKTIRPLGQESDKAYALLNALTEEQKKQAILNYKVADLVLGPGQDGKTIQPEGLKASAMTDKQRAMLLDLISEWTGIVHESAAAARLAEVKASINDTWFAWSGSTAVEPGHGGTAYFRVQGPTLVIEYSPQPLGNDPTLHVHSMYRDPTNDYGKKLAAK